MPPDRVHRPRSPDDARGWAYDLLFVAIIAALLAAPLLSLGGPSAQSTGSSSSSGQSGSSGGSGGSGGEGSAGGSGSGGLEGGSGSGGSGSGGSGSGGSGSGGSGSGGSGSGPGSGGSGSGGSGGMPGEPEASAAPAPAPGDPATSPPPEPAEPAAGAPPPGTSLETSADRLPPYVPLVCLAGKVPGVELRGDTSQVTEMCADVRVEPLRRRFAPFSSGEGNVDITDVDLTIEVLEPAQSPVVVVTPRVDDTANRVLTTLFGAVLLVLVAGGIALALRQQRGSGGSPS